MRRLAWLFLLAASCVDLSRPSVLVNGRDAPAFDTRGGTGGGTGGTGGGGASGDGSPGDVPMVLDADQPSPDMGEPIDTVGLDLLIIDPPDMAPPDLPLVANGKPCDQGIQCASGVCSSGVCCDRACSVSCYSCTLNGKLGTCSPVPAGEDPGNSCSAEAPSTCGRDGTCDGNGGCRRYLINTQCADGRCSNATEFAAGTCDGAGTCRPGASKSCAPGICMGASCASSCSANDQCQTGFFCDSSKCTVKRPNGMACTMAFQCSSNFCVDGTCCDSQCGEMCRACNVGGSLGTCTMVPSGMDPRNQCVAEAAATCGRAGGCNGAGACLLHPMGTTCAGSSCINPFTETTARTCNGLGVCQPPTGRTCAPYFCSGSGCPTSCTDSAQCQPGFQCTGNACVRIPGLALYWRFEESMGTTAFDSSGNNFNGTFTGVVGIPAPSMVIPPAVMYPNALSREYTQANRQVARLSPFPAALRVSNNVTISVWYRSTSLDPTGSSTPVGEELVSVGNSYLIRLRAANATGPLGVELSKTTSSNSPANCRIAAPNILDGNWHHFAGVLDASGPYRVYFDGVERLCPTDRRDNIAYAGSNEMSVGRHANGEDQWDFGGNIDEVRIYTRVLSVAEIMALAMGKNAP